MKKIITAALFALAGTAIYAQGTGSEGYFQLYNDTEGNLLIGFYTNDGGGWSDNWIDGAVVEPGQNGTASFTANTGSCDQLFMASWLGADESEVFDDPIEIDICAASNVYLSDNEIYYD